MTSDNYPTDAEGIPLLDNPLSAQALAAEPRGAPPAALEDPALIARVLQDSAVQHLLEDMSGDLQKLVSRQMEELLQQELARLINQSVAQQAPKLAADICTQLQLSLPGLLAAVMGRAREPGTSD